MLKLTERSETKTKASPQNLVNFLFRLVLELKWFLPLFLLTRPTWPRFGFWMSTGFVHSKPGPMKSSRSPILTVPENAIFESKTIFPQFFELNLLFKIINFLSIFSISVCTRPVCFYDFSLKEAVR